jgi:YD repeat-containing protein
VARCSSRKCHLGTLEAISPDPIPPVPGGSAGDPAVYPAHLLERTVTRGTQSWRTTFEFHLADGRFNDYGRAYRVRAYDEGTVTYQQAQTTFDYSFLVGTPPPYPYVLPVASVVATLGAETATTAYTYDMLTGFVTTVTTRGRTTTFTRTARGNVASVRDAVRPATTFEYSWGVVSLITPPLGPVTTRSIRPDGLAEWERLGTAPATLTTAYEYDQIGRVTLVTPPGGSGGARWPTFYNYDATHSRTLWVMRGDLANPATHRVQQTDLDDFGRVLRTIDPAGVKVEVAYDACGRTTATSLPPRRDDSWLGDVDVRRPGPRPHDDDPHHDIDNVDDVMDLPGRRRDGDRSVGGHLRYRAFGDQRRAPAGADEPPAG